MARNEAAEIPVNGSLSNASVDRLTCLLRHWTWANEAMARFEQELAGGWEYDEDPVADRPFGAHYHCCALLCGFSEAALSARSRCLESSICWIPKRQSLARRPCSTPASTIPNWPRPGTAANR